MVILQFSEKKNQNINKNKNKTFYSNGIFPHLEFYSVSNLY